MNVLLVAPDYATDPATGGGQRTQLLFNSLLQHDEITHVDVLLLGGSEIAPQFFSGHGFGKVITNHFIGRGDIGFWKLFRKLNPDLIDNIATALGRRRVGYSSKMIAKTSPVNLHDYDLIVGRYLKITAMSGCFEEHNAPPVLLDIDDRDDVLYSSRLKSPTLSLPMRLMLNWHWHQAKSIQKKLLPLCKHCWLASAHDLNVLPTISESVLPNIPYTLKTPIHTLPPIEAGNHQLLFVGSFGHRINREGIEWFLNHCWDDLKKTVPDATLRIVGSGGWENIEAHFKTFNGVEIIGFCENLEDEYKSAALTIAPLFEGGGTKIKVLESFLFGRLAFGAPHAFTGYEYIAKICSGALPESSTDFTDKLGKLLIDSEQINRLAYKGQSLVEENFSFATFKAAVAKEITAQTK